MFIRWFIVVDMESTPASRTYVPFKEVLDDALQDPEVRAEWDRTQLADDVSNWVLRYRIENDLTQTELADRLGWPQSVVARLESGDREPSMSTLHRLVERLGTTATIAIRPGRINVQFSKPNVSVANEIHQRRRAQRLAALDTNSSPRPRRAPITRRGGAKRRSAVAT
jgi:transcriptional regulator with XRE-family HTH domain